MSDTCRSSDVLPVIAFVLPRSWRQLLNRQRGNAAKQAPYECASFPKATRTPNASR
jgi:hypothetical protein